MAYPISITTYPSRIDKQASGWYVSGEYFNVPAATPYQIYLDHVPQQESNTTVYASGGAEWTEDTTGSPAATEFYVNYTTGLVSFNSANASAAVEARYYSLGDDIMAEHMNNVQNEVFDIETELGYNPSAEYADISERLEAIKDGTGTIMPSGVKGDLIIDDTIRAGALMDDIKGAAWQTLSYPNLSSNKTDIDDHISDAISAHAASAIAVTGPGSTTFVDIEDHINAGGGGTKTDVNPHGMTMVEVGAAGGDTFINGILTVTGLSIDGSIIRASGNSMGMNVDGPDEDQFLYFYDNSTPAHKQIAWDDVNNKFSMNDALEVSGTLEVEAIAASGSITVDASGTRNVATLALPIGTGNFDEVQAVDYKTGDSSGADGDFTTTDGKTVTVKSGLIVSIV